jgi:hypothetical protein
MGSCTRSPRFLGPIVLRPAISQRSDRVDQQAYNQQFGRHSTGHTTQFPCADTSHLHDALCRSSFSNQKRECSAWAGHFEVQNRTALPRGENPGRSHISFGIHNRLAETADLRHMALSPENAKLFLGPTILTTQVCVAGPHGQSLLFEHNRTHVRMSFGTTPCGAHKCSNTEARSCGFEHRVRRVACVRCSGLFGTCGPSRPAAATSCVSSFFPKNETPPIGPHFSMQNALP